MKQQTERLDVKMRDRSRPGCTILSLFRLVPGVRSLQDYRVSSSHAARIKFSDVQEPGAPNCGGTLAMLGQVLP